MEVGLSDRRVDPGEVVDQALVGGSFQYTDRTDDPQPARHGPAPSRTLVDEQEVGVDLFGETDRGAFADVKSGDGWDGRRLDYGKPAGGWSMKRRIASGRWGCRISSAIWLGIRDATEERRQHLRRMNPDKNVQRGIVRDDPHHRVAGPIRSSSV